MRRGALSLLRFLLVPLLLRAAPAFGQTPPASEPAFCVPDSFHAHEIAAPASPGVVRLRAFRLGARVLAGMAIGDSDAAAVAQLAEGSGRRSPHRGLCRNV